MLSDEEKKATQRIDYIQDFIIENGQYNADVNDMEYFSKVLNLIEKQSKEIEELKDKNKKLKDKARELIFEKQELSSALLDSIPNDKIKAKIEEIDNMELCSMRTPKLSTLDERLGAKIGIKYVLQSLLDKE